MTYSLAPFIWTAIASLAVMGITVAVFLKPAAATVAPAPDRLLARRLHHSRLGVMLHRHHVTEGRYFANVPHDEAVAQIDACANCSHAFHCDQVLACKGTQARLDVSFCPNGETVLALSGGR